MKAIALALILASPAAAHVPARTPIAWTVFCHYHPAQCDYHPDLRPPGMTHAEMRRQLEAVRAAVNASILPRHDAPHRDVWSLHPRAGDCDDVAVSARADLLALGWPSDALRLAVVRTRDGRGHLVLLARVGGADLVIDNALGRVLPMGRTGYRLIRAQDGAGGWVEAGNDI